MSRFARVKHRLRRDVRGVTVVEFALITPPMLLLLLGGLEIGYQSYVRSVLQGALNDAARTASVENPQISTPGNTVEEKVAGLISGTVKHVAPKATVTVTQQSFFEFSNIGNPEKLMTDHNGNGEFDAADGDCWEDTKENGVYDTDTGTSGRGGANDVVLYNASVSTPRLLPIHAFIPRMDKTIDFTVETAVRNQPYQALQTAPVLCG